MKTFTATELNKEPSKVFRAVDKDGEVMIKHDRYPDVEFIISAAKKAEEDSLIDYLLFHEDDIAIGINDFGDLRGVFEDKLKRAARDDC